MNPIFKGGIRTGDINWGVSTMKFLEADKISSETEEREKMRLRATP